MRVPIYLTVWSEKTTGHGEDAYPILEVRGGAGLLAVFDGMGGSGAATYLDTEGQPRTGAYLGSRLACEVVKNFWARNSFSQEEAISFVDRLKDDLTNSIQATVNRYQAPKSQLKSSLVRRLPTTLAAIIYNSQENATATGDYYYVLSTWAGDSRCYMLTPDAGLQQLSNDDLMESVDAFANLTADFPLSNCVNADQPVSLNRSSRITAGPLLLITATDGCFHYVPTPMHFEYLVLKSLLEASDEGQWRENLSQKISEITGDDASMALIGLGWSQFTALREAFQERLETMEGQYINPLDEAREKATRSRAELEAAERRSHNLQLSLWAEYKRSYEKCAPKGEKTFRRQ